MNDNKNRPASNAAWYCRKDPEKERFYEIFFRLCQKYNVRWASATPKEKAFIEEVTRVTYERIRRSVLDCLCQKFVLLLRHRVVCSTHGETNEQSTRSKEFSTSSFCGKNASKALCSNGWKFFIAW